MNLNKFIRTRAIYVLIFLAPFLSGAQTNVLFDSISVYHHIQVYDFAGTRTLSFNGSWETTMSLTNPLTGHFEYTEYFQMPWLWNQDIKRVLMVGLGGGSTPRAYQHYYPNVMVDMVEIDPKVVEVAKKYFTVAESPTFKININDGRVFLRQSTNTYDVILMDAYSTTRYGSSLPRQLATKEFFELASRHLSTNGVFAYNVIGQIKGFRATLIGAMYRTMGEVFPRVYMFPAVESENVVFVATKSTEPYDFASATVAARKLVSSGKVTLPTFLERERSFTAQPPPTIGTSPLLTDDYAPIETLLQGTK
jgi:spermidine synthase